MAKVSPYYTVTPENDPATHHRNVYHDHDDCPDGRRIKQEHRKPGTASRPRCDECIRLG